MIASIDNSGRRFVSLGPKAAGRFYKSRFPFFDNDLMTCAFSIPEHMQANSTIYKKMLLAAFPDYFRDIPWQKTGVTIDKPRWVERSSQLRQGILPFYSHLAFCLDGVEDVQVPEYGCAVLRCVE